MTMSINDEVTIKLTHNQTHKLFHLDKSKQLRLKRKGIIYYIEPSTYYSDTGVFDWTGKKYINAKVVDAYGETLS